MEIRQGGGNPRRRMSKTPLILNGEHSSDECGAEYDDLGSATEVNMVAAMQDHLSCTKTVDFLKTHESKENKVTLPYELDHMYANCSENRTVSKEESQQVKCMKDWLLLNLDLMQQQQEQLTLKDLQISALRQEQETLKKQLQAAEEQLTSLQQEHNLLKEKCSSELAFSKTRDATQNRDRKKTKINCISSEKQQKRFSSVDSPFSNSKRHSISTSREEASINNCKDENNLKFFHKKSGSHQKKDEFLQTDIMYYTPVGEINRPYDMPSVNEPVLVPTWRIRQFSSCYQLEGTENLDNEIFLKRHQKLEIDEKRRKRWDIQRLREQRLHEKLKRGRSGNKELFRNRSPEMTSFYPSFEEAQAIEVSDTIPVTAFGHTIPHIESSEYHIPWLELSNSELPDFDRTISGPQCKTNRSSDSKHGS